MDKVSVESSLIIGGNMIKVRFNGRMHRGPGERRNSPNNMYAAGWYVMPNNLARIVPDNWSITHDT